MNPLTTEQRAAIHDLVDYAMEHEVYLTITACPDDKVQAVALNAYAAVLSSARDIGSCALHYDGPALAGPYLAVHRADDADAEVPA